MKKVLFSLLAIILIASTFSQTPEKMSYQAVIRDDNGQLITSTIVGMQISILQSSPTGNDVYVETHTPTTNTNGLVSIEIGNGSVESGDFTTIDWANGPYFIKTETDLAGGSSYTITGVSQLLSVPYALYAKEAGNVPDVSGIASNATAISTNLQAIKDTANSLKAYIDELKEEMDELKIENGTYALTDIDGNTYNVVKIGEQVWMAENLKVTQYADGTAIPLVTANAAWGNLGDNDTDKAYCYYDNDDSLDYRVLYTFATATNGDISGNNVQGVCPSGWHLPNDAEWTELENYISNDGHSGVEGTALKATSEWRSGGKGTDDYGFCALPGGYRTINDGTFSNAYYYGLWWSSTQYDNFTAYQRFLEFSSADLHSNCSYKSLGLSIRCVRD